MNILVTGSAGMIGGYVVKGLIEKGHKVIGVDRRKNDNFNLNDNVNCFEHESFESFEHGYC